MILCCVLDTFDFFFRLTSYSVNLAGTSAYENFPSFPMMSCMASRTASMVNLHDSTSVATTPSCSPSHCVMIALNSAFSNGSSWSSSVACGRGSCRRRITPKASTVSALGGFGAHVSTGRGAKPKTTYFMPRAERVAAVTVVSTAERSFGLPPFRFEG